MKKRKLKIFLLDDDWDDCLHHKGKYADKPEKSTSEGPETVKPQDGKDPKDGSKDAKTSTEEVCDTKKLEPPIIRLDDDWLHRKPKKSKRTMEKTSKPHDGEHRRKGSKNPRK